MTRKISTLAALLLASSLVTAPLYAAGTHPETGEALADDQTSFTAFSTNTARLTRRSSKTCPDQNLFATF